MIINEIITGKARKILCIITAENYDQSTIIAIKL